MQGKAFLTFIIMSTILMGGYLICMATSPSPGWNPTGTPHTDADYWTHHDNAYGNVYCAYNYYTSGGVKKWRTYHWGHLDVASDKKFNFTVEWKRGEPVGGGGTNGYPVSDWGTYDITTPTTDSIWESQYWSPEIDVQQGWTMYPYSALRSNDNRTQDVSEANWQPNGVTP